ncbi:hypothetical protein ACFFRR_011324 [Megaselia abdita]
MDCIERASLNKLFFPFVCSTYLCCVFDDVHFILPFGFTLNKLSVIFILFLAVIVEKLCLPTNHPTSEHISPMSHSFHTTSCELVREEVIVIADSGVGFPPLLKILLNV